MDQALPIKKVVKSFAGISMTPVNFTSFWMEFLADFLTFDTTVQHRAGEHSVTYVENSSILFIVAIDAAQQSHRM